MTGHSGEPRIEVLHAGPYATETSTIRRPRELVVASGDEIAGPHAEEYPTRPGARTQKTVGRYRVRPRVH